MEKQNFRSFTPSESAEWLRSHQPQVLEEWNRLLHEADASVTSLALGAQVPAFLEFIVNSVEKSAISFDAINLFDWKNVSLDRVMSDLRFFRKAFLKVASNEGSFDFASQGIVHEAIDAGIESVARFLRERTAKELKVTSENLTHLFDQTSVIVSFMKGPDFVFEYVNPAHVALIGANATGRRVLDVQPEAATNGILELLKRVYQGETVQIPDAAYTIGTSMKYFDFIFAPSRDRDGNVNGVMAIVNDVTGQFLAKQGLKTVNDTLDSSLTKLSSLFEQAPVALAMLEGSTHRYAFANTLYRKIFIGQKPYQDLPIENVLPEIRQQGFLRLLDHVFENGESFQGKGSPLFSKNEHGETSIRYIDFAFVPVKDSELKVTGVLVSISDVTEQSLAAKMVEVSEARAHQIANAMPQIVWTANPDGSVDWFNDRWYEYVGRKREGDGKWDDADSPVHADDLPIILAAWKKAIHSGEPYEVEHRFKRGSDGKFLWFIARGLPVRDEEGQITKWIGTNTEINDHKDLLDRLQSEKLMRESFVATLTHDLRTPITSAKLSAQLAKRKLSDPALWPLLDRCVLGMDRADQMIRDLLDANRIQAGEAMLLSFDNCNADEVVNAVVTEMQDLSENRLVFENQAINAQAVWDASAVQRVVQNLVGNAIKYGESRKPISLKLSRLNDAYTIAVHNFGASIPPEEQTKLFDQFARVSTAYAGGHLGWGIGLPLAKGITEAHGGTVSVESSPTAGTTFTVTLPVKPVGVAAFQKN